MAKGIEEAETEQDAISTAVANLTQHGTTEAREIGERIRVARDRMLAEGARIHLAIDTKARRVFLAALSAGLLVDDAAEVCGRSVAALYRLRNRDEAFRRDWDDAREASCAPIERRLEEIARHGAIDSMATVRAAEVSLRHRDPRRYQNAGQARVEMRTSAEGGSLSVRLGTPGPD